MPTVRMQTDAGATQSTSLNMSGEWVGEAMARSMLHKFEKVWRWGHTRAGVGPCMVGEEVGQVPVYGYASPEQRHDRKHYLPLTSLAGSKDAEDFS